MNDAVTVARSGPGSTFIRRVVFGVAAIAMALASVMMAWAPKAEAQTLGPIEQIVGGALTPETMEAICGDTGADDGALGCVGMLAESGLDFADCVTPEDDNADDARKKEISDCVKDLFESFQSKDKEEDKSKDEPEGPPDLSLYRVSSALTSMYVNSLVPGGLDGMGSGGSGDSGSDDSDSSDSEGGEGAGDSEDSSAESSSETTNVTENWRPILGKVSTAGGAVSRPDERSAENSKWLLGVGDGSNDARFSYDSFVRENTDAPDTGVSLYNDYGAVLNGLGLDSTIDKENSGGGLIGQAGSSLMLLAYMGSGAIDTLFDGVVHLLQSLNPFYWLYKGVSNNTSETFTQGMKGTEQHNSAFGDLQDFLADLYDGVAAIGWYVTIPLFIGLTVAGMLFMNRFDKGKNTKNLVLRVAFLVVGVPLLGVTYTGALENLKGASGDAAGANSSKIVLSTYVDFDNWANKARLSPPGQGEGALIQWDRAASAPTEDSQASVRRTALAINALANEDWKDLSEGSTAGDDYDNSFFSGVLDKDSKSLDNSGKSYAGVVDLLSRSIKNETISSANYESGVKGALSALSNDPVLRDDKEAQAKIAGWIKDYSSAEELSNMTKEEIDEINPNPVIDVKSGMSAIHFPADNTGGEVTIFEGDGNTQNCTSSAVITGWQPGWGAAPAGVGEEGYDGRADCNMSPLAMYNYLNTSFGSNSATVYSPNSSVSAYSRNQHASVSMVGSGMMQTVYWMSSMTLLVSFILIGLFYALSMMFGTIKRGLQLIGSIPFATMGFMAAIAKTVVYTAAMFLEIFGTLIMYKIVQEFLMIVPSLLEKPIANADGGEGFGSTVVGQVPLASEHPMISVLIMTVIGTVGTLVFVIMAIKMRGSLISAFDEAMTRLVNKFTDSQVSSTSEPGGGALRQGLTRGAGMAATHAVLSGGNDAGDGDGGSGDGSGNGPGDSGNGMTAAAGGAAGAGGLMAASDAQAGADEPGIESMGADADSGNGMESSEQAAGAEDQGVPAGNYDMDANGNLVDGSGNPITDANGNPVGADAITSTDANGNLVGDSGQPLSDADGQPIPASAVGGMNSDGYLTDASGGELTDGNGQPIPAEGVASGDQMAGVGVGSGAQEASFAGDRSMADQVMSQGGLSGPAAEAMPYAGEATSDMGAVAGQYGQSQMPASTGGGNVAGPAAAGGAAAGGLAGMASASAPKVLGDAASRATGGSAATEGVGQAAVNNISSAGHQAASEVRTIRESMGGGAGGNQGYYPAPGQGPSGPAPQTPMAGHAPMPHVPTGPNITGPAPSSQGPGVMGMMGAGLAGAAASRGAQSVVGPHRSRDLSENTGGRGGAGGASGAQGKPGGQGKKPRRGQNMGMNMGMRTAMMLGNQGLGGDGTGGDGQGQNPQNPGSPRGPGDGGTPMQGGPRPGGGGRNG